MKEKIITKASEMFLKLGFKSITMDDIAGEMCISKKRFTNIFTIKNLSKKALHRYIKFTE
jgi:AcrR family transcriptional regulator